MYMYLLTKETKKLDDDDDKHLGGVEKSRPNNQKVLLLSLHGSLTGGIKYPRTKYKNLCEPKSSRNCADRLCVHIPSQALEATTQMDSVHLSDSCQSRKEGEKLMEKKTIETREIVELSA